MGGVLGRYAAALRHEPWPDACQSDETDTGDAEAVRAQVRTKWRRQLPGENVGIDPIVHEDPAFDGAADERDSHRTSPVIA